MTDKRFRAMADAAPIGIYMTDARGHCTYTNAAWQALYGLTLTQSLGRSWAEVVHPDDQERLFERLRGAAGGPCEVEFRLKLQDGTLRSVVGRSNPIIDARGAVTGHVGTVIDVTESRQLEAARHANSVAQESARRQAEFMSRASHELRTPLNAILGFGQLLQLAPELIEGRAQSYVQHMVHAGRHMLALVEDLLELQTLEPGRPAPVQASLDLAQLLAASADLLAPSAKDTGAELVLSGPPVLMVRSDERSLRQIALNLGSNAIKYGRAAEGTTRIVIAAGVEGGRPWFSVADPGQGLTVEQIGRLFQPFERLGRQSGTTPGTGLGLVIARQLADRIGAEIAVHSESGLGTTVVVRLPAWSGDDAVPQDPREDGMRSMASATAPRPTANATPLPDSGNSASR